jgi:glycosyltransferase involved in cell wall biosynthesis
MSTGRAIRTRPYRVYFALIVITGNVTRYEITRPIVEADPTIESRWFPIRTWVHGDILRFVPGWFRIRLRHFLDSWRLLVAPPADAVVIHAFETYAMYAVVHWLLRRKTILVKNPDGRVCPTRPGLRGWPQRLAIRLTDLFVPWSHEAMRLTKEMNPSIPSEKIIALHPGIDLTQWRLRPPKPVGERFQLLFVGGDAVRKGITTLLDAFEGALHETCDLHIVTQTPYLPVEVARRALQLENCHLHLDLTSGSDDLRRLYRGADAFVLPTNADASSWVALEAMATGLPVVITPMGGIPEIVQDGETGFLIPPSDPDALVRAVERLRTDDALRARIVAQARRHVEAHFDAHRNTATLLDAVKRLVDARNGVDRTSVDLAHASPIEVPYARVDDEPEVAVAQG